MRPKKFPRLILHDIDPIMFHASDWVSRKSIVWPVAVMDSVNRVAKVEIIECWTLKRE